MTDTYKKIAPDVGAPEGKKRIFTQEYYNRDSEKFQRKIIVIKKKGPAFQCERGCL